MLKLEIFTLPLYGYLTHAMACKLVSVWVNQHGQMGGHNILEYVF